MSVEALVAPPASGTYRIVVFVAALAAASCAASEIERDYAAPVFDHPPPFGDRFTFRELPVQSLEKSALHPLARTFSIELGNLQRAKVMLAQKLDEVRGRTEGAVPLPRSRPVRADPDAAKIAANGASDQTLMQKITGLFGGGIKLASLAPDALSEGTSIRSLGIDDHTAVYDISARAVYMPGGAKLEAHSGFGALRDSPEHVGERDLGATPPAIYDLRPRELLFHGVHALRMLPVDGQSTLGRDGLLAHGYMLGPEGDSNGCVSIKDYDRFLAAFQNGEITRLQVVTSLSAAVRANQVPL